MKPKLGITKIWQDDDMMELRIDACDGTSTFSNKVYVGHHNLRDVVSEINTFKDHIYGGIYDLRFGELLLCLVAVRLRVINWGEEFEELKIDLGLRSVLPMTRFEK